MIYLTSSTSFTIVSSYTATQKVSGRDGEDGPREEDDEQERLLSSIIEYWCRYSKPNTSVIEKITTNIEKIRFRMILVTCLI